jgi:hypothetical protein
VRIQLIEDDEAREEERRKVSDNGFPFTVPEEDLATPRDVINASKDCNTPVHRRLKAKDQSVM